MSYFYNFWDDFVSLFFPRICYGCGNHLLRNEKGSSVRNVIFFNTKNQLSPDQEQSCCSAFLGQMHDRKAAAFSFYTKGSRIRKLVHNLKYKGVTEIGNEIGRIYANSLKASGFFDDIDLIVPVPLHPSKKRIRGFNQCEYISSGISEVAGLPVELKSLIRISVSDTQTRRSRYDRWMNVEGIFGVTDPEVFRGKHILLVDDVITTGSTFESCVAALLKIENVKVSVVALWAVELFNDQYLTLRGFLFIKSFQLLYDLSETGLLL